MTLSYMKLFGGIFAATANFLVLLQSDNVMDAVKDFIAVGIIY